jgi:predicted nucleic acid-binding protein
LHEPGDQKKHVWEFFLRGAALLVPSSRATLLRVAELMEKYRDVSMDYADGTLVALGEEAGTDQVFTLDRKGFSTYRIRGKKAFRVVP